MQNNIIYLDEVPNAVAKAGPSFIITLYGDLRVSRKYSIGNIKNPCNIRPIKMVNI